MESVLFFFGAVLTKYTLACYPVQEQLSKLTRIRWHFSAIVCKWKNWTWIWQTSWKLRDGLFSEVAMICFRRRGEMFRLQRGVCRAKTMFSSARWLATSFGDHFLWTQQKKAVGDEGPRKSGSSEAEGRTWNGYTPDDSYMDPMGDPIFC